MDEDSEKKQDIRKKMTSTKIQANKAESRLERLQRDKQKLEDDSFNFSPEKMKKIKELEVQIKESEDEWLKLNGELEKLQRKLGGN